MPTPEKRLAEAQQHIAEQEAREAQDELRKEQAKARDEAGLEREDAALKNLNVPRQTHDAVITPELADERARKQERDQLAGSHAVHNTQQRSLHTKSDNVTGGGHQL